MSARHLTTRETLATYDQGRRNRDRIAQEIRRAPAKVPKAWGDRLSDAVDEILARRRR